MPVADPAGDRIAVSADAVTGGGGLLVYARSGSFVAKAPTAAAGPVFWSGSGTALMYSASGEAVIWQPGGRAEQIALPRGVGELNGCAWSPDEQRLACSGYPAHGGAMTAWVVIDRRTSTATAYTPAGTPLLWSGR